MLSPTDNVVLFIIIALVLKLSIWYELLCLILTEKFFIVVDCCYWLFCLLKE